jgi:hypothetical protein
VTDTGKDCSHVSNFQISNAGIVRSIEFGSNTSILNQQVKEDAIHWLFTGMIFIMGLYHLGIYFLRIKDLTPLYFGIYCILSSIREFYIIERGINRIFIEINFFYWIRIDQFFLFLSITSFASLDITPFASLDITLDVTLDVKSLNFSPESIKKLQNHKT